MKLDSICTLHPREEEEARLGGKKDKDDDKDKGKGMIGKLLHVRVAQLLTSLFFFFTYFWNFSEGYIP